MKLLRKYAAVPVAGGLAVVNSFPALASETSAVVSSTDWKPVIDAITGQITVANVVGVLATAIGAGIGFVFMWWGGRKAIRVLMSAMRKGRVSM